MLNLTAQIVRKITKLGQSKFDGNCQKTKQTYLKPSQLIAPAHLE